MWRHVLELHCSICGTDCTLKSDVGLRAKAHILLLGDRGAASSVPVACTVGYVRSLSDYGMSDNSVIYPRRTGIIASASAFV